MFLKSQILPYYELYEFLLDSNPDFVLNCSEYKPIPIVKEVSMSSGEVVDVESVEILKEFVGERLPKEEKKDPKKK